MKIRNATGSDIPAITAIYARSVEQEFASFELEAPSADEMKTHMDDLLAQNYPYIVAEQDGEVVGYAHCSAHRPRPAYAKTVENTVYVAELAWRKGIGKKLLSALINEAHANDYQQMIGVIAADPNESSETNPSVLLHRSLGFEQAGQLRAVGHKHGKWLDVVLMQLTL